MELLTLVLILLSIITIGYVYLHRKFTFWKRRGVPGPAPALWRFGNMLDYELYGFQKVALAWQAKYGKFGKMYGHYRGTRPILTVLDPELVKQVMVKDFQCFSSREKNYFEHEYFATNLFSADGEQWRRVRSITTPTFTSGKLKGMQMMMHECIDKLIDYLYVLCNTQQGNINMKEVITAFTIDVIATTAFATDTNPYGRQNAKNPFVVNGCKFLDLELWRVISFFAFPSKFNQWIGNTAGMDDKALDFFVNLSKEIVKQRKAANKGKRASAAAVRNDLVQLMMDSYVYEEDLNDKNANLEVSEDGADTETKDVLGSAKKTLTEQEIIGQCLIFFIAGFDTTATTISMASYYMALNPEVQEQLYGVLCSELDGMDTKSAEYYEKVNDIPYLEAVIKETLRMNPPLSWLQRQLTTKEYTLAGIKLENDQEVQIPAFAIHHNPKFYPDPERFDPERFMPENKHNLIPYTFIPFGAGSRNCIGMRFAFQEIKLNLSTLVRKFRFEKSLKTKVPLPLGNFGFLTCSDIQLKICAR